MSKVFPRSVTPYLASVIGIGIVLLSGSAIAQQSDPGASGGLVNVESPSILPVHGYAARLDVRTFSGDENLTYTTLGVRLGLSQSWELGVRGLFADTNTFSLPNEGTISHGGSDVEVLARYAVPNTGRTRLAGYAGFSMPNTPAQNGGVFTLGLADEIQLGNGAALVLNPRSVLLKSNAIVGFGAGLRVKLFDHFALVGDFTPIISGNNTRDAVTGSLSHRDIYGAALRYTIRDSRISVDLGVTNGTGFTTGASLTPGLGGCGAFYISISVSR